MPRPVSPSIHCALAIALVAVAVAGCQSIGEPGELTSDSLLKAAASSPGAVTLDIYWARTSIDDAQFAEALWKTVQEDRLPVEVRRELAEHGLRAGVVGGTPCEQLVELLNPDGKDLDADASPGLLASPPQVTRRLKQIALDQRLELQATDSPQPFALLENRNNQLVGRQFDDAQGIYALKAKSSLSGRVELQLLPELHYGQPRMKYTPSGPGMVVQQLAREVMSFDELRLTAELAPGEMLVVTCLPDATHRMGGLFHHTDVESFTEKKYLLVRLAQVPEQANLVADDSGHWPWR